MLNLIPKYKVTSMLKNISNFCKKTKRIIRVKQLRYSKAMQGCPYNGYCPYDINDPFDCTDCLRR